MMGVQPDFSMQFSVYTNIQKTSLLHLNFYIRNNEILHLLTLYIYSQLNWTYKNIQLDLLTWIQFVPTKYKPLLY